MNAKRKPALVILVVGESGVGKSEFVLVNSKGFPMPRRGAESRVNEKVVSTIGLDFVETQRVHIECPDSNTTHTDACKALHRETVVNYQVWDTAGQERFRSCVNSFMRTADVVLLFYDLTDGASFDALRNYWLPSVSEYLDPATTPFFVVGTKSDLLTENGGEHERGVPFAQVDKLIDELSASTSSLPGSPAAEAFDASSYAEGGWHSYNTMTQISEKLVKSGYAERIVAKKTALMTPQTPGERSRSRGKMRC
jgi:GTPase SAR1 family protein